MSGTTATHERTLRIGQLSVYFGLFDEAMPAAFRHEREQFASTVRDWLARFGEVEFPGLVDSDESGRQLGEVLAAAELDVVVFVPTMAAPPSYAWHALEAIPDVPIVTAALQEIASVPVTYDTEEATRRSLPVGHVMLTNVLVRRKRPFMSIAGVLGSPRLDDEMADVMRAMRAVSVVRGRRFLQVGSPIAGYDDVEVTEEQLTGLGATRVEVSREELDATIAGIDEATVGQQSARLSAAYDTAALSDGVLERSARLAVALQRLCDDQNVVGGTVNCHGDMLRWNPNVGITACLAVCEQSVSGRPFSCTGDVPTAIALAMGKAVATSALYCELYAMDVEGDWILVANGGEGDATIRPDGSPVALLDEDHYLGVNGAGVAVTFPVSAGPATLISLTPTDDPANAWILVAAEGTIVGSHHDRMEGPNGMFRFASGSVRDGYAAWCEAGATHHAALLPGHHGLTLQRSARALDVTYRAV